MDLINNLIYTALNQTRSVPAFNPIETNFIILPQTLTQSSLPGLGTGLTSSYHINVREDFTAIDDSDFIERSIQKHWADMVLGGQDYVNAGNTVTSFNNPPNNLVPLYHLIYAYLVENTRIAQIMERLLYFYMHDEKLTKATSANPINRRAFQWMVNAENLFFKNQDNSSYRNISSMVRLFPDATRRNAYFRMLGMDLAFGDLQANTAVNYHKAEFNNQPFIVLFEKFLTEIWQAYTNARNTSGANTTDLFIIVDTAQKIQEMLMSRRTTEANFQNYRYFNLSREEYASVVMMSWFYEVVSYDSPLITFLGCHGNTPGERLINMGKKVGVAAHSKSEGLLDIAPVMNTLLRRIELGDYNRENELNVRTIIESQTPTSIATIPQRQALTDLLIIINNWEKATGHRIKNPEANINGTVRIEPQRQVSSGV